MTYGQCPPRNPGARIGPFQQALRDYRRLYHVSHDEFAKMLGVSSPFLSQLENGRKPLPAPRIDRLPTAHLRQLAREDRILAEIDKYQARITELEQNLDALRAKEAA